MKQGIKALWKAMIDNGFDVDETSLYNIVTSLKEGGYDVELDKNSKQGSFASLSDALIPFGFVAGRGNTVYYMNGQPYVAFCDDFKVWVYSKEKGETKIKPHSLSKHTKLELFKTIRQNSLLKLKQYE